MCDPIPSRHLTIILQSQHNIFATSELNLAVERCVLQSRSPLSLAPINRPYGSYIQYLGDEVTRTMYKHWICGPTETAKLTHSLLHMSNGEEGVIQPTLARGVSIEVDCEFFNNAIIVLLRTGT